VNSRREFLKCSGALIVSFSTAAFPDLRGQGPFDTHPSHIDPKALDSWLAVGADGKVTAYTGNATLGKASLRRRLSWWRRSWAVRLIGSS
jgi:hypothetical protein